MGRGLSVLHYSKPENAAALMDHRDISGLVLNGSLYPTWIPAPTEPVLNEVSG